MSGAARTTDVSSDNLHAALYELQTHIFLLEADIFILLILPIKQLRPGWSGRGVKRSSQGQREHQWGMGPEPESPRLQMCVLFL